MKWQADEIASQWNEKLAKMAYQQRGNLMKLQRGEMASWWNGKVMKMKSLWNGKLMKWHFGEMASWCNGRLSVKFTNCQIIEMPNNGMQSS
jgi:hypothetical protein